VNTANEVFFSEMRLEGNREGSGNEEGNNNGMSYYAARRRRNSSVELKVLNITFGVKAAVRIMASEMSELPEMTMENVEVLISECRPDFEDLRYDHFYQVKPPATPKIREPADPNTPYRLPLFSILTYAAFTRVIGIVHLVPWYLGLHITVFVIFAAGYYLSPSYKWFYLFLVMLVARGVGFP
jgi:hypothetical protein